MRTHYTLTHTLKYILAYIERVQTQRDNETERQRETEKQRNRQTEGMGRNVANSLG